MLHSLRDAVVVPRAAAELARTALADRPGSQIIVADSLDLAAQPVSVDGIRCPPGLESLIYALRERFVQRHAPTRADDDALGLSVLGDFPEPLVGKDSLVRRAERELAIAEGAKSTAESVLRVADAARTLADITHKAAEAHARLVEIDEEMRVLDANIASIDGKIGPTKDSQEVARKTHEDALVGLRTYEGTMERHKQQIKDANDAESGVRRELDTAVEERKNIPVEAWSGEFGGTEEDAVLLWEANAGGPKAQTQPGSLLRQTSEELRAALAEFEAGSGPRDYIAAAEDERAIFADQKASNPVPFERIAGPMRTRLQGFVDHDRATQVRIESMQAQREQALATLQGDLEDSSGDLITVQEMAAIIPKSSPVR